MKIIKLCNDPKSNTSDIEIPIKSDPAVAAMVIKRANSAIYGGMGPVRSIPRAIIRLGMRSTRNIAASFSVLKLFVKEDKNLGFNRTWFWMHSLATGICAQLLASELNFKYPEDAFIAGLLHDIGKMIMDDFMSDEYYRALKMANTEGIPIRKAESSLFDVNHAYIGSKVAKTWEFPPIIVDAIEKHHHYTQLANMGNVVSMNDIVCVANQMAKAIQAGNGGDYLVEPAALPLWKFLPENISWENIVDKAFEELRSFIEVLEIPPDQIQITVPKSTEGEVGIFCPHEINYGTILRIALYRKGFKSTKFSSLFDPSVTDRKYSFIICDLTSMEDKGDIKELQSKIGKISDKVIILPATDKNGNPNTLDLFWLEKQIEKYSV